MKDELPWMHSQSRSEEAIIEARVLFRPTTNFTGAAGASTAAGRPRTAGSAEGLCGAGGAGGVGFAGGASGAGAASGSGAPSAAAAASVSPAPPGARSSSGTSASGKCSSMTSRSSGLTSSILSAGPFTMIVPFNGWATMTRLPCLSPSVRSTVVRPRITPLGQKAFSMFRTSSSSAMTGTCPWQCDRTPGGRGRSRRGAAFTDV
mmetsp:Transcript_56452/g.175585  ORF Transcript_56452/g.175585 Transcript_56452/m.175585 type:complete len:205 (-) Transcript_56452:20-634(-)